MQRNLLALASLCTLAQVAVGQWSTLVPEASVNTSSSEYSPALTFDGLTLYFAANGDIHRSTRTARYQPFGAPVRVAELASAQEDWSTFSRFDDLEIFFSSQRPGGGGGGPYDMWRADRTSTSLPFNAPVPVLELNSTANEYSPSLTLDGLRMYFTSDRPGGTGARDIWTCTRPNWSQPFGTPTPVTELNTSSSERDPWVSPDNLVMFFTSDQPGGLGNLDIWMASRLDTSSPFGNIVNLAALSSTVLDFSATFAAYHDEVFLSSQRPGGPGGWDIYSSRFTGIVSFGFAGPGSTQDLRSSDPASAGRVYLAVSSRGSSPGIQIGTRVLPLNPDLLFQLTIGGLPPILTGYVGALDRDGIAAGRINFANFPGFAGFRFFTAFVVLDPAAPFGIGTISNAHPTLVQ
jgi:hypothetical protein